MIKKSILFVILVSISACERDQYPLPKLSENATILAFGDSLTYGTGASQNKDFPSILAEMTSLNVINEGMPGEISQNGLIRLPDLLDLHQPELLILTHGGNDLIRRIPRTETEANLNKMIDEARQRNIAVVMLGVPVFGLFLLESDEIYQSVANTYQIPSDLEVLPNILSDNSLKSDVVHPNDKGYRLMAESIFQLLQDKGAL